MAMTQSEVNQAFKETQDLWETMLQESGLSLSMFLMTHPAIDFLSSFEQIRLAVIADGLVVGKLVEGIEITFHD